MSWAAASARTSPTVRLKSALPLAFSRLPFGTLAAATFFVLLAVAAFASAISMLELPRVFLGSVWLVRVRSRQ
jgi:SNF family Na+-dependent transporter